MMARFSLLLIFIGLAGCRSEAPLEEQSSIPESVVAVVGTEWIDASEIEHLIAVGGARDDAQALRILVQQAQLAELARIEGFSEQPEIRVAQRRFLAARFLEQMESILAPPPVSDAAVQAAYETSDHFKLPGRRKVAALRQQFNDPESAEIAQSKLLAAREAYQALPEDPNRRGFGSLAVTYSDEPNTRFQGGLCGWLEQGSQHLILPQAAVDLAESREAPGLCSDVLVAPEAAWLVLVLDIEPAMKRPFEHVKFELRRELEQARKRALRQTVLQNAADLAPVKMLHDIPQYNAGALPHVGLQPPNVKQ